MRYLIFCLFLVGCVSQQEARERDSASARQYCYNVAQSMYGIPELARERALEYQDCLRRLGF